MHKKRYESELDTETGLFWGVVVQYGDRNRVKGKARVTKGHATADEAARAAYALFPQSVKRLDKKTGEFGWTVLSFEEANDLPEPGAAVREAEAVVSGEGL